MKFRVERDVLAEAVAWAARSLPARPPVPVLAGLMLDADTERRRLVLSSFDYEVSARVEIAADVSEPGVGAGQRPAARRHLPQPARPPGRGRHRRRPRSSLTCGSVAVHAAHAAGRGLPGAARDARRVRVAARRRCSPPPSPRSSIAAGRDDTLPVLTGVRLEIEGEKITMAATDRYRLAVRELAWTPEQAGLSAIALVPARTLADTAKSLAARRQGDRRARVRPAPARAWSASRAPAGARPRGCSTASSPSTARCCPPSRPASPPSRPPRSSSRYAGSRWSPSATPRSG